MDCDGNLKKGITETRVAPKETRKRKKQKTYKNKDNYKKYSYKKRRKTSRFSKNK